MKGPFLLLGGQGMGEGGVQESAANPECPDSRHVLYLLCHPLLDKDAACASKYDQTSKRSEGRARSRRSY